ncbi:MAG: chemotaxis protein CheB [Acidobacteriota bacterium]
MSTAGDQSRAVRPRRVRSLSERRPVSLIVVGCSLGGLQALQVILKGLPAGFQIPIAVAQHRHPKSSEVLAQHLQRSSTLEISDAEDLQPIESGHIYLAPANYHLVVDRGSLRLSVDDAVQYSRPSIDVLFDSAADSYRQRAVGVVLTGANTDGANGARRIREHGGLILVQDPKEAEAPVMPEAAIAATTPSAVLTLVQITEYLTDRLEYEI